MATLRPSLRTFLGKAKSALDDALKDASHKTPVTFVLGNESADLDSLCSAVVLAYFRTHWPSSSPSPLSPRIYIPLSNLHAKDLGLRPELVPSLKPANLSPSDLITFSDLPPLDQLSQALPPSTTRLLLVDHNALTGDLAKIYPHSLVGVIDHHEEEHAVPKDCPDEPRIVEKSGSCSSLVVRYCKSTWDELAKSQSGKSDNNLDAEIAHVALAPILIDTTNLQSKGKVTPADLDACSYLESFIKSSASFKSFNRDDHHCNIAAAKSDLSSLSLNDILRKDYKQWSATSPTKRTQTLGISSVVRGLNYLISKAGSEEAFLSEVKKYAQEKGLDIVAVMTAFTAEDGERKGEFCRELLVWAVGGEEAVEAAEKFEKDAWNDLDLKEWKNGELDAEEKEKYSRRRCWMQMNLNCSRKQVAPLMRRAMI